MYGRGMRIIQIFLAGVGMHTPQTPLSVGGLHLPHTTVSPPAKKHLPTSLINCGMCVVRILERERERRDKT